MGLNFYQDFVLCINRELSGKMFDHDHRDARCCFRASHILLVSLCPTVYFSAHYTYANVVLCYLACKTLFS